jgi:hypothetical protein
MGEDNALNKSIENALKKTLEVIKEEHSKTVGQNPLTNSKNPITKGKNSKTTQDN